MKAKKTFNVAELVTNVNELLKSEHHNADYRQALIDVTASILHQTGNYHGFNYLYSDELPNGVVAGINHDPNKNYMPHPDYKERFDNTDSTRIKFY